MTKRSKILVLSSVVSISLLSVGLLYVFRYDVRASVSSTTARMSSPSTEEFPNINTSELTETQQAIVRLAKQEYKKKPISYDANVLTYTQGNKEAWCADFVSWVMKEANAPLTNPNSSSWRIPGVYTLQEYYQSENKYKLAKEYSPKVGDVAIYIGAQTPDPSSQEHTAIVIKVDGKKITTVGGNENGRMRIATRLASEGVNGLAGFGVL